MPTAPKELKANLRYRRKVLELGASSQTARDEIWLACSRDPVFFSDTMLWTFDPQNYPDAPERPLILRPHQDKARRRIGNAIGNHSLIFPKTRRMGVTTSILAELFHRWVFRRMQSFLLLSAKEDRVDNKGDKSSLFWKLDHMLDRLPWWMRPPCDRAKLRFANAENDSVFIGESTNADAGRGGVQTAVLADEVGAMPNAESVIDAIGPLTETLFLVSTPQGAYGAFYKKYCDWMKDAPSWVVLLHWTMHAEFSKGLYFTNDPISGYYDPAWNGKKPRSPWYDKECLKLTGPRRIAQELDIAFNEAGGSYFEVELIDRLLKQCRKPARVGEIEFDEDTFEPKWAERTNGRFSVWCPISEKKLPPRGRYGIGFDIASGKGGSMSSQSTISVLDLDSGQKVAQFKHDRIPPSRLAKLGVAVAKWFWDAKIIWGRQGPGSEFEVEITRYCRYFNFFRTKDDKPGFPETGTDNRSAMFGDYRQALHDNRFKNPAQDAVEELRQFIYASDGSIQHSQAIQKDMDPEHKGKLHGDLVIADALVNMLLPATLPIDEPKPMSAIEYPERSAGGRLKKYLEQLEQEQYA